MHEVSVAKTVSGNIPSIEANNLSRLEFQLGVPIIVGTMAVSLPDVVQMMACKSRNMRSLVPEALSTRKILLYTKGGIIAGIVYAIRRFLRNHASVLR